MSSSLRIPSRSDAAMAAIPNVKGERTPLLSSVPPLRILYLDTDYLLIDKPSDIRMDGDFEQTVKLLVDRDVPFPDLPEGVPIELIRRWRACHQLDYATSGALLFASHAGAAAAACASFETRHTEKQYVALLEGILTSPPCGIPGVLSETEGRFLQSTTTQFSPGKGLNVVAAGTDFVVDKSNNKGSVAVLTRANRVHIAGGVNTSIILPRSDVKFYALLRKKCSILPIETLGAEIARKRWHEIKTIARDERLSQQQISTLSSSTSSSSCCNCSGIDSSCILCDPDVCMDTHLNKILHLNITHLHDFSWANIVTHACSIASRADARRFSRVRAAAQLSMINTETSLLSAPAITVAEETIVNDNHHSSFFVTIPIADAVEGEFCMSLGAHVGGDINLLPGRPALTRVTLLGHGIFNGKPVTKVLLQPFSGRRHQLRLHTASIGHPIVGDATYGSNNSSNDSSSSSSNSGSNSGDVIMDEPRMMLAARMLQIDLHWLLKGPRLSGASKAACLCVTARQRRGDDLIIHGDAGDPFIDKVFHFLQQ